MLRLNILNFINIIQNRIFKHIDKTISLNDHLSLKNNFKKKRDLKNIKLLDVNSDSKFFNHSLEQILLLNIDNSPIDILILEKILRGEDIQNYDQYFELLEAVEKQNPDVLFVKYRLLLYRTYQARDESEELELRDQLDHYISINQWNTLSEFQYGLSYLLHSALNLFQTCKTHENRVYLEQSSERILRKLEIGRDKHIDFKNISLTYSKVFEQLKVINFCLRLCDENKDLRFLNAAMKALDRIYSFVKDIDLTNKSDAGSLEILYLYSLNIERQEKLFTELV